MYLRVSSNRVICVLRGVYGGIRGGCGYYTYASRRAPLSQAGSMFLLILIQKEKALSGTNVLKKV